MKLSEKTKSAIATGIILTAFAVIFVLVLKWSVPLGRGGVIPVSITLGLILLGISQTDTLIKIPLWFFKKGKLIAIMTILFFSIVGTFKGSYNGIWPFTAKKTGNSWGINVVGIAKMNSGVFKGINLSLGSKLDGYKIYGANLGVANSAQGEPSEIKGAELSLFFNTANRAGRGSYKKSVDGLQASLFYNSSDTPNSFLIQIGLVNSIKLARGAYRRSFLVNLYIKGLID